jgi:pimeloyl-ACP methyl ester carboxylesterase
MTFVALAAAAVSAPSAGRCAGELVPAGNARLWANLQGAGNITVVFESGNGNDSTVWTDIAPRVRAAGVRTLVYDRAGLGKSGPPPHSYSIGEEVVRLQALLQACGVGGPIMMVGASHGGSISLLLAARDRRIKSLVLVDAVIPDVATDAWAQQLRTAARKDYVEVRREVPAMAAAVIPVIEAMPATARQLRRARLPAGLPIIDIVADKAAVPGNDPKADADWIAGHRNFVARGRNRSSVLAVGSGHKVMIDKPDFVVAAILQMIARAVSSG